MNINPVNRKANINMKSNSEKFFSSKLSVEKEDKDLILDILSRLKNGKTDVIKYKQIAALGVFDDIIDDNKKDVLLANGANGLSTFLSYFIFSAIDKLGHHEDSINYLKQY